MRLTDEEAAELLKRLGYNFKKYANNKPATNLFERPYERQIQELTPRQKDVLKCLSHGMTAIMAAEALGLSLETVKVHLKAARGRLCAKSSTHAVALAIRYNQIP